jgi:hypothetical protein
MLAYAALYSQCWAEALLKIARMTLTIKLDGNWSSFQLANSAPPLSVTDSALAPSARIPARRFKNNNSLAHKIKSPLAEGFFSSATPLKCVQEVGSCSQANYL